MSISTMQQLEAFAFWRRQLLAAPVGQQLWGLDKAIEAKLMNQAPLYALSGQKVDFYVEAPLLGPIQVDLSAQYFAEAFAEANPLQDGQLSQEGAFFHYYAKELARLKPALLRHCNLYFEADITAEGEPKVASFINLSGDFVDELLMPVLAYKGHLKQAHFVTNLLASLKEWCEPWHFGFMESRATKPLRLVLVLKQGLKNLDAVLECVEAGGIPSEGRKILAKIDALGIFNFMLDMDVLADGSLGDIIGIELIPKEAIYPGTQRRLVQTKAFAELCRLLMEVGLADQRIEGLPNSIMAVPMSTDVYIYSRISHFKLRWRGGQAMPTKCYVQMRPVKRQSCLNEGLGYVKQVVSGEDKKYEH